MSNERNDGGLVPVNPDVAKIAPAYPYSPTVRNSRGIERTDWVQIDRAAYDAWIDPRDYRPKKPAGT